MSIYEENLSAILKYKPSLYKDIKKIEEDNITNLCLIEAVKTKDNIKALIIKIKDKKYRLNSIYHPLEEAQRWVDQYDFKNLGIVVVMFGFGNGIFTSKILEHLSNNDKILIYEPSKDIFQFVLNNYDLVDLWMNPKLNLFVGKEKEVDFINELGGNSHWTNIYSQIICKHPQYENAFLENYRDFLVIVNENYERTLINRNTESYFGKAIVKNTISNLRYINEAQTVTQYVNKLPKDVPAIIVSAGPSLDKNIEELKSAKGKAVIVATDTALKYLFAHDIDPDFVVTMDPLKPAEYFSNPRCNTVPMFCKIEANWRILHNHTDKKIWFSCHPYLNKIYSKFGKVISFYQAGGSVATGAFSICAALKFDRIVLIGQDLAYGNGVTHAGGDISRIRAEEDGIRMIEDIYGNMVKTRHDWYIYLKWFENSIQEIPDIEVIDATEGGAKISGTKLMTLKEVIAQYCNKPVNCKEIINSIPPLLNEEEVNRSKVLIADSIKDLERVSIKTSKAIEVSTRLIRKCKNNQYNTNQFNKMVDDITKINNDIESTMIYDLIDTYISQDTSKKLANIYQYSDDEKEDRIQTFERAREMYQVINEAVKEIKPMLEENVEA